MTIAIYTGLFLTAAAYAFALAKLRHLWEPHLTWLEVVAGTALCLLAPYLAARQDSALTWAEYEALVWAAFAVGGAPILIWQLTQSIKAWRTIERRIRSRNGNTRHPPDQGATLAEKRRMGAEDDD